MLVLVGVLLVALLISVDPAAADAPNLRCRDRNASGTPWFDDTFNKVRNGSLSDRVLRDGVPQGLATWANYYGAGKDLMVYTAYRSPDGAGRAFLQGVDPRDGSKTHIARIRDGHVGGVASSGKWVFVTHRHDGGQTHIRRYSKAALARIFSGQLSDATIDGQHVGTISHASFITARGNTLFAGTHEIDELGRMRRYRISSTGNLSYISGSTIRIPEKTQGVAVLKNNFVFSTSYGRTNRSNLYVVRRGYQTYSVGSKAGNLWCVRAPVMTEGVAVSNGRVHLIFESAARKYITDGKGRPTQRIRYMFRTPTTRFTSRLN